MRIGPIALGEPLEQIQFNGEVIAIRDKHGLPMDPQIWADPKCTQCWAKGVISKLKLVAMRGTPSSEGTVSVTHQQQSVMASCGCASKRYQRYVRENAAMLANHVLTYVRPSPQPAPPPLLVLPNGAPYDPNPQRVHDALHGDRKDQIIRLPSDLTRMR